MHRDTALDPRFPERGHEFLRPVRAGHFWFTHRRAAIVRLAAECLRRLDDPRVLEFGCGDGDVLESLTRRWWSVGLERRFADVLHAHGNGLRVVLAEGSAPPFLAGFDLVGLFDVVEHVEDDAALLRRASALARPGGYVLLTVPADPRLWSSLDDYAGHVRRYTHDAVADLLARAQLEPIKRIPLFRTLWPLARLKARFVGNRPVSDPEREYRVSAPLNRILSVALGLENVVAGRSEAGIGTSWLVAARTPNGVRL